jgi:Flp pilus assembly protein TadB
MNGPNNSNGNPDLERRERELRQRELEFRIRELEGELKHREGQMPQSAAPAGNPVETPRPETPVSPTKPYKAKKTRWNLWQGKIWMGFQFFLIVVGVIVAIRIANWLGAILIVGMLSWVIYKIFFEVDD